MSEKKLFIVTLKIKSVVLAEDETDACYVAAQNRADIMDDANAYSPACWNAHPCHKLPANWDDDDLPWVSLDENTDELTCKYYLNKG